MKYKIFLIIILTFLFSSEIFSNQKYAGLNNWGNNKIENLKNYKISFSFKFSKKGVNFKNLHNKNFNLKSPGSFAGVVLYLFVFLPIGFLSMIASIPLLVVGVYGLNSNWPNNSTTPFFVSGGICAGSGLCFATFPLIAVFN